MAQNLAKSSDCFSLRTVRMASELHQQLSKHREKHIVSAPIHAGAPSLFLEAKEASKIDISEVYASAIKCAEALSQFDRRFQPFFGNLLHESSMSLQRELKTGKDNKKLNIELASLFNVLSLYASVPSMHLVLEYLIRRYRVHEYNAHELILCMITQHDTMVIPLIHLK